MCQPLRGSLRSVLYGSFKQNVLFLSNIFLPEFIKLLVIVDLSMAAAKAQRNTDNIHSADIVACLFCCPLYPEYVEKYWLVQLGRIEWEKYVLLICCVRLSWP